MESKSEVYRIRKREEHKRYYERHKERILKEKKDRYENNKEKYLESFKKYYNNNKEKIKKKNAKYIESHPEVIKKSYMKGIASLNDKYVKTRLRESGLYDPPKELIELKRTTIKLKRTLKTKTNENSK